MFHRKKPLSEIRVLLIQARNTLEMEQQEQTCFVERCRVSGFATLQ